MTEYIPLLLIVATFFLLLVGYPVAFSLAGTALIFAGAGILTDTFDIAFLSALPARIFGIMFNQDLLAVPLFVFMGLVLERAKISEDLLVNMAGLFGRLHGGLAISVCLVGGLLAASTGIVGATVVTMGLISLPLMLRSGYSPQFTTGLICASGTLGQIIPPSIVLVVLGDVISTAHQQAQLDQGIFNPKAISVGDLFVGAIIPGLLLMGLYLIYTILCALIWPQKFPVARVPKVRMAQMIISLAYPLCLIAGVLGSILFGVATPTEAAAIGGVGAMVLAALKRKLSWDRLREVCMQTTHTSAMVFTILIGASVFSLVFRGFAGDEWITGILTGMNAGPQASLGAVMLVIFLLGFFLDFFEITFVIIPLVGPVLLGMGIDALWFGILVALNLQTSFLTPPFGFSLFYLRGVMPREVSTTQMYWGVIPFIGLQLIIILMVYWFPALVTWLPGKLL